MTNLMVEFLAPILDIGCYDEYTDETLVALFATTRTRIGPLPPNALLLRVDIGPTTIRLEFIPALVRRSAEYALGLADRIGGIHEGDYTDLFDFRSDAYDFLVKEWTLNRAMRGRKGRDNAVNVIELSFSPRIELRR